MHQQLLLRAGVWYLVHLGNVHLIGTEVVDVLLGNAQLLGLLFGIAYGCCAEETNQ